MNAQYVFLAVAVSLCAISMAASAQGAEKKRITVDELNQNVEIVGKLGKPLGTIIQVEGSIIDGSSLRIKSLEGVLLLRIERLDGSVLKEAQIFRYRSFDGKVPALKLGSPVSLVGYESGEFFGTPKAAFEHVKPFTSQSFHFRSYFAIVLETSKSRSVPDAANE